MEYYQALGIEKTDDTSVIKKAYRKSAMKFHPDKNPGNKQAEERFKLVNEAYSILSDPEKKQIYDQYGKRGLENAGSSHQSQNVDPRDIFEHFFGGSFWGNQNKRARKCSDIRIKINTTLKDHIFGANKNVKFSTKVDCKPCGGSGGDRYTCRQCNGLGQVNVQRGFMNITTTCPTCLGSGSILKNACKACNGQGQIKEQRVKEIKIPVGLRPGQTLKFNSEGNTKDGYVPGDLLVTFECVEEREVSIEGNDLVLNLEVDCIDACLGYRQAIDTFDGEKMVKIPAGIQEGNKVKMKNLGFPTSVNSRFRGDLLLKVSIKVPKNLSSSQIKKLEDYRNA